MAFFCGTGSFSHADDDPGPPSTPRGGSKRRQGGGGSGNPYSTRGLEKFSVVLADLENRREKIMEEAGSQGVALVKFVYSNSDDWVPIVVRPREQSPPSPGEKPKKGQAAQKRPDAPEERPTAPPSQLPPTAAEQAEAARDRAVRKSPSWKVGEGEGGGMLRWKPSYYLPVAVALVLLCLAAFGRSFAICCASIWWYLLPIVATKGGESRGVRMSAKKDHGRRASERRLGAAPGGGDAAAPAQGRRAGGGLESLLSPRGHHASMKR